MLVYLSDYVFSFEPFVESLLEFHIDVIQIDVLVSFRIVVSVTAQFLLRQWRIYFIILEYNVCVAPRVYQQREYEHDYIITYVLAICLGIIILLERSWKEMRIS